MDKKKLIRNWHRKKEILVASSIIMLVCLSIIVVQADVNTAPNNGIDVASKGMEVKNIPSNDNAVSLSYSSKHRKPIQTPAQSDPPKGPTNQTPTEILAKIQPLLIPANMINPDRPLYDSQDNKYPIYIYKLPGTDPVVLVFQSSGAIDCDGQTTTQCNKNADPWYQSQTSFVQSDGKSLSAAELPFYVLPEKGSQYFDFAKNNIAGGQLGTVLYGNNMNYGVFGDENGDSQSTGEISYAMASSLGIDPSPHYGGVSCCGVTFIVFTSSENIVSPIESHSHASTMGNVAMSKLMQQLG